MGSNYIRRPLWVVIGFTLLLAMAGPYLLLNTYLGDNPPKNRALLAGELASATPVPRAAPTERPSPTTTTTAHAISTLTPTAMAPGSNFDGAYVSGVTWLDSGDTMVRIVVPNGVAGDYHAEVATSRTLEYACLIPEGYEDRIYCIGSRLTRGATATIQVYHRASPERLVFVSEFLAFEVLPTPTATPTPGANSAFSSGTPTLAPTPSPSSSGTPTPSPTLSASQTATPLSSPSATPSPTSTLIGSTPTATPSPTSTLLGSTATATASASSATPASATSTSVPSQTPSGPSPPVAPTDEPTEECKGPDHPVFPCTETPAPAPTDPPTSAPEPTQEPIPTP